MTRKIKKVVAYFVCLSLILMTLSVMNSITAMALDGKEINGVFDSEFYTDSQKLTADMAYNNVVPVTEADDVGVKSEIWYNFDADYMYFYVKTTDTDLTYTDDVWGNSDATSLFLDMNPSAGDYYVEGSNDISVGVVGETLTVVNASSLAVYKPGMFKSFKDTESNTYGFELKVAKRAGEASFGINVVNWDCTSGKIIASGPQWWGTHTDALQYVKTDFYTDSQKLTADMAYNNVVPVTEAGNIGIKSEIWYNFDADYMYFYVKTTDTDLTYTGDTWTNSDATSLFLDMNPSAGDGYDAGDVRVGIFGKSRGLEAQSTAEISDTSKFHRFKDAASNTYGFELKVAKRAGETSVGINVVNWDCTNGKIIANGPQWWGTHTDALQYVKTDFYTDDKKITVDTAYNSTNAALIGKSNDVKTEVWYNWDVDYMYFYVKSTDPLLSFDINGSAWGEASDATAIFLDMNPSAGDGHGVGDISIGVVGKTMTIVNATSPGLYAPGMFHKFKDAASNTYGFQLKVAKQPGETGCSINVVNWDSTQSQALAMGPQWWGDQAASLQFVGEFLLGGINSDDYITSQDIVDVKKVMLSLKQLNTKQKAAGDLNKDGKIDVSDLVLLKKMIVG